MAYKEKQSYQIEVIGFQWPNFAGKEKRFNPEGSRNFQAVISAESASQLQAVGFRVNEEDGVHTLKVNIGYKFFSPIVYMVRSNGKIRLNENCVGMLDIMGLVRGDIVVNGSEYQDQNSGRTMLSAWLHTGYVIVNDSTFDSRYSQIPTVGGEDDEYGLCPVFPSE